MTPSVQRFMRQLEYKNPAETIGYNPPAMVGDPPTPRQAIGVPRRTADMGLRRPHPDFDIRTMAPRHREDVEDSRTTDYTRVQPAPSPRNDDSNRFALSVEVDATTSLLNDPNQGSAGDYQIPTLPTTPVNRTGISTLTMPMVNSSLFERPQAELHMNLRNLDRDPFFRNQNTARLAGVSTHHSNVFMIRMTLGYFVVDPTTGAVAQEYVDETGDTIRKQGTYMIDRTIPVGFLRGRDIDVGRAILYAETEE